MQQQLITVKTQLCVAGIGNGGLGVLGPPHFLQRGAGPLIFTLGPSHCDANRQFHSQILILIHISNIVYKSTLC